MTKRLSQKDRDRFVWKKGQVIWLDEADETKPPEPPPVKKG